MLNRPEFESLELTKRDSAAANDNGTRNLMYCDTKTLKRLIKNIHVVPFIMQYYMNGE